MPLWDRFKKVFNAGANDSSTTSKTALPSYVEQNVDPWERWEVIGELGDGAFGKVHKTRDKRKLDRLAAAKSIEIEAEEEISDFLVEIEILSECQHRNIVGLHEAYLYGNHLYILLEFCAGGAVDQIMVELEKPLNERQIQYVTHEVTEALRFLHSCCVIHRDLKAGNILLTAEGTVKLADFGVSAKLASQHAKRDSFIGTPYWMAPEVMRCETFKDDPYDTRSDIWSLGITCIEMAQMEPPNAEIGPMRVLLKIQKSPPPTLEKPHLWSAAFHAFLARCLHKFPSERLPASELLSDPFIARKGGSDNRRCMIDLLNELNAEVVLEEIQEDAASGDGRHSGGVNDVGGPVIGMGGDMDDDNRSRLTIESSSEQESSGRASSVSLPPTSLPGTISSSGGDVILSRLPDDLIEYRNQEDDNKYRNQYDEYRNQDDDDKYRNHHEKVGGHISSYPSDHRQQKQEDIATSQVHDHNGIQNNSNDRPRTSASSAQYQSRENLHHSQPDPYELKLEQSELIEDNRYDHRPPPVVPKHHSYGSSTEISTATTTSSSELPNSIPSRVEHFSSSSVNNRPPPPPPVATKKKRAPPPPAQENLDISLNRQSESAEIGVSISQGIQSTTANNIESDHRHPQLASGSSSDDGGVGADENHQSASSRPSNLRISSSSNNQEQRPQEDDIMDDEAVQVLEDLYDVLRKEDGSSSNDHLQQQTQSNKNSDSNTAPMTPTSLMTPNSDDFPEPPSPITHVPPSLLNGEEGFSSPSSSSLPPTPTATNMNGNNRFDHHQEPSPSSSQTSAYHYPQNISQENSPSVSIEEHQDRHRRSSTSSSGGRGGSRPHNFVLNNEDEQRHTRRRSSSTKEAVVQNYNTISSAPIIVNDEQNNGGLINVRIPPSPSPPPHRQQQKVERDQTKQPDEMEVSGVVLEQRSPNVSAVRAAIEAAAASTAPSSSKHDRRSLSPESNVVRQNDGGAAVVRRISSSNERSGSRWEKQFGEQESSLPTDVSSVQQQHASAEKLGIREGIINQNKRLVEEQHRRFNEMGSNIINNQKPFVSPNNKNKNTAQHVLNSSDPSASTSSHYINSDSAAESLTVASSAENKRKSVSEIAQRLERGQSPSERSRVSLSSGAGAVNKPPHSGTGGGNKTPYPGAAPRPPSHRSKSALNESNELNSSTASPPAYGRNVNGLPLTDGSTASNRRSAPPVTVPLSVNVKDRAKEVQKSLERLQNPHRKEPEQKPPKKLLHHSSASSLIHPPFSNNFKVPPQPRRTSPQPHPPPSQDQQQAAASSAKKPLHIRMEEMVYFGVDPLNSRKSVASSTTGEIHDYLPNSPPPMPPPHSSPFSSSSSSSSATNPGTGKILNNNNKKQQHGVVMDRDNNGPIMAFGDDDDYAVATSSNINIISNPSTSQQRDNYHHNHHHRQQHQPPPESNNRTDDDFIAVGDVIKTSTADSGGSKVGSKKMRSNENQLAAVVVPAMPQHEAPRLPSHQNQHHSPPTPPPPNPHRTSQHPNQPHQMMGVDEDGLPMPMPLLTAADVPPPPLPSHQQDRIDPSNTETVPPPEPEPDYDVNTPRTSTVIDQNWNRKSSNWESRESSGLLPYPYERGGPETIIATNGNGPPYYNNNNNNDNRHQQQQQQQQLESESWRSVDNNNWSRQHPVHQLNGGSFKSVRTTNTTDSDDNSGHSSFNNNNNNDGYSPLQRQSDRRKPVSPSSDNNNGGSSKKSRFGSREVLNHSAWASADHQQRRRSHHQNGMGSSTPMNRHQQSQENLVVESSGSGANAQAKQQQSQPPAPSEPSTSSSLLSNGNAPSNSTQSNSDNKPQSTSNNGDASTKQRGGPGGPRKDPFKRTLMRKTRVYEIDGKKVSSTTYHILADDGVSFQTKADHDMRKAELQELKRLQKEENRQFQELSLHSQMMRDQTDKKFDQEKQAMTRTFEMDLESMARVQKKQIEDAEKAQEDELRAAAKRLKGEQERELKAFRDHLKQEQKLIKQEVDMLPKAQRKDALRMRTKQMEDDQMLREQQFVEQLQRGSEQTIRRMQEAYKQKIALTEKQFLQQKHQLLRAKEAAQWELEERQMQDRHQLHKQQMKDHFFLQRSQMLARHGKELEQVKRLNDRKFEESQRAIAAEKKRLPKLLRSEAKTRSLMFKESLRINMSDGGVDIQEKMKMFEEQEKRRIQTEMKKQENKHRRRLEHLKTTNEATVKELEQIQNEKRKMLLEHESAKLKQFDDEYQGEVKQWKSQLKPRKQTLEGQFKKELEEQERFYNPEGSIGGLISAASSNNLVGSRASLDAI